MLYVFYLIQVPLFIIIMFDFVVDPFSDRSKLYSRLIASMISIMIVTGGYEALSTEVNNGKVYKGITIDNLPEGYYHKVYHQKYSGSLPISVRYNRIDTIKELYSVTDTALVIDCDTIRSKDIKQSDYIK